MTRHVFFEAGQGGCLIGGLDWRLLPTGGSVEAHLREGGSDRGAGFAALATASTSVEIKVKGKTSQTRRVSAGYYASAESTRPPKGAHSLAAAFGRWAHRHPEALLNVKVRDDLYAVVVVIDGLPVLDTVAPTADEAYDKTVSYLQERPAISVFSDDDEKYPRSLLAVGLLDEIARATGKSTAIRAIPPDTVKLLLVTTVVLGAIGGYWYHGQWKAEKARQEALARAREQDPVPKYLSALAAARQEVGATRASLEASVAAAQRIPLAPDGWAARRIACAVQVGCEAVFGRTTGTYAGLKAAIPFLALSPASDVNLNDARMTWKPDLAPDQLDPENRLPALGAFIQGPEASKLQNWLVAGLTIQLAPPQLWPQAPGVPSTFKHPQALANGKFELSAIALPQLAEALAAAPQNVKWTGWSIELGDEKQEPLARAKARLTGTYYVTQY
ncbi:type 4b pilus protein PilO2 [Variovorax sp. KK3]|uniref:type 4b pilus protein PilO2 n=1 Tax=Variovorax sp. KK3 TaxID=1855728 RepID=UPI00097C6648|nr:type 4b pilus protein PilO2 [Variovorax sp. KK3]